ncbi:MarR family transcriptional regulator [Palaeococcus pacificus DY20341]|uniref:MarR family transcriptional regulator n=1 Tax=Palaeococcus pacificus DY20341 TaxID=1343739 RepID=A0A075LX22_9EURY|nr:Rrf2 family transcriptional regulator [Palaeococcus pacificus]AIF69088.1 MarR family transcriptional regulator [Palaeococcus pacificus DY20341]
MDAKEMVFEIMKKAGKPLKSAEIAELAGLPKKDVDKAIKALKKEGKITSPKRCYYAPVE